MVESYKELLDKPMSQYSIKDTAQVYVGAIALVAGLGVVARVGTKALGKIKSLRATNQINETE